MKIVYTLARGREKRAIVLTSYTHAANSIIIIHAHVRQSIVYRAHIIRYVNNHDNNIIYTTDYYYIS